MATLNGNYREFRLENGLLVALQETPTQTVSGRLRVWHGALNEARGEEGLAHFLEHTLMTGGSQKYDPQKADEIRGTFPYFNAFTSQDSTYFPIGVLGEDTGLFLEYISDATISPRFEPTRVEEERQRVLRELADNKSNPLFKATRDYDEAFFGKGSPHTYLILGKEDIVSAATIDSLREFHKRGFSPNNMDLILVGAMPKNIEELINKNFGSIPSGNGKKAAFPRNPQLYGATILHTPAPELYNAENPTESSAQLSISLFAPTETDADNPAVNMLTYILGGDLSSRLFQNISQRRGLAYAVSAGYNGSRNQGRIIVGGSIPSRRAEEAIDAFFDEMSTMRTDLVSQESLDRIKRNSRYSMARTFETNEGHVNAIESKMDRGITPEIALGRIEAVTPEDIREAAQKYLPQSRAGGNYVLMLRDPLKS